MHLLIFLAGLGSFAHAQAPVTLKTPNVSANALFLFRNSNFGAQDETTEGRNGIDVQEAEVSLYSDVDPYSRLFLTLSVAPKYEMVGGKLTQKWEVVPEEAFAESDHIPWTTLRLGKFKAAFGKHNLLHSHAFPFVDAPVANTALLGDEGLNDPGLSAAVLLPTPWFSELTAQYLRGEGENTPFKSPSPNDGVGLAHWKNLWDLSDALTFEAGGSYAQGGNYLGGNTYLAGADLTFRWRPSIGGKYHSWILASEFIYRRLDQPGADMNEIGSGFNVWGKYQFAERWSIATRYDHLGATASDSTINTNSLNNATIDKESVAVVFSPSEFSSFRLEFDYARRPANLKGESEEKKIYFQANFTIGAHPSHAY